MKELDLDKYLFDSSELAYRSEKCMRIHFQGKRKSHRLDAGPHTELHVQTMSQVEIRTWNRPQIEVELPDRLFPFELYWAKDYVSLRENPNPHSAQKPSRVIIRAPYHLGFVNLILSQNASCEMDNLANLTCVMTTDDSQAVVAAYPASCLCHPPAQPWC